VIEARNDKEKVTVVVEDVVIAEKEEVIADAKEVTATEEKETKDLINGDDHLNQRRNQQRIRNNPKGLLPKRNDQIQKEEMIVFHPKKVAKKGNN